MLDYKMTSLSPTTPLSILSECYGMWDHENMNSSLLTKLDNTDIMDLVEPLTSSTGLDYSGPGGVLTLHPTPNLFPHHHHHPHLHPHHHHPGIMSPYQTPPPSAYVPSSLTIDSYSSIPDNSQQFLDTFPPMPGMNSPFHKLSEGSSSFSEYDNYIPDYFGHQLMNSPLPHFQSTSHLGSSIPPPLHHHSPLPPSSFILHDSGTISNEYTWETLNCPQGHEYPFLRKGDSPNTSESILSYTDVDSEFDSKSSRESLSRFTEISHPNGSPPKRRVGRPPKKDKKVKRATEKKTGRLWEFIRDLLKNPEYCPSLVRWENPEEGHFRFVNSEKVAQLWGEIKGNPRMTYEKLSRAMRYYYKSHVFEPVLGRRLVYKFGYNATNWRPINPNFVQPKLYN